MINTNMKNYSNNLLEEYSQELKLKLSKIENIGYFLF